MRSDNKKSFLDETVVVKFTLKDYFAIKCFLGDLIRIIVMNGDGPISESSKKLLDDVSHLYSVLDNSYEKEVKK